jgi:hypothetical protein
MTTENKNNELVSIREEPKPEPTPTFTQEDVDKLIAKKLKEEQKRLQKEQEEQEALKQGEYAKIAEQAKAEAENTRVQYDNLYAEHTRLQDVIEKGIADRIKALPEELQAMLPEGNVTERLTALQKAEVAAKKLALDSTKGTPKGSKNLGTNSPGNTTQDNVATKMKSGFYGGF